MITEKDLEEAIAECQGQRNPNASTCIKLAAFLTIQKELFGEKQIAEISKTSIPAYSYASGPEESVEEHTVGYYGDSDFLRAIEGHNAEDVWLIMDELMESMAVIQPRIYDQVMRRIRNIE